MTNPSDGKHRSFTTAPHVLVVAPGDLSLPHGGDVEAARQFQRVLSLNFQSSFYQFSGHSILMARSRFLLRLTSWILGYCKYLLTHRLDVVIVYNHPELSFFTGLLKRTLSLNFKVIPFTAYFPRAEYAFDRESVRRILWLWATALSDAIACDPSVRRIADLHTKPAFELPDTFVDTDNFCFDPAARSTIRDSLGLGDSKVIGIIGPFHALNAPSIEWLWKNLDKFRPEFKFMLTGDCPPTYRLSSPRLIYVGRVDDFAGCLSACDCVLIPRFHASGSPMNKMICSMSVGLPVLTNSPEGMLVTNEEDAVIGPLEDLPRLTNELMVDPEITKRIGNNARAFVEKHYSLSSVEPSFTRCIRSVLAE